MNICIATIKSWNIESAKRLKQDYPHDRIDIITQKEQLTEEYLRELKPEYIFFPHWSWIIPAAIHENYHCVVFHMTDLPFGRGGSPLQNLIVRGIYQTKISAIRVGKGMDTGEIYLKEPIAIDSGNASEIFKRVSDIIFVKMIPQFLDHPLTPTPQTGEPVVFARRTREQSELPKDLSPRQIYDYIRMLDGEGYPPAFIRHGKNTFILRDAEYLDGKVSARIILKSEED